MKIYIDGKYYDKDEAKVSVFDHGFLYGDGVFEGIRVYERRVFKLKEHLVRLYESARAISLTIPIAIEEMEAAVIDSVQVNEKVNGYIRLIVSRGDGPLGIDPFRCPKAKVIIIVGDIQLYPEEFYEKGICITISSYRRIPAQCLDPRVKSLNYLNNILSKIEAHKSGCLESVMLNIEGNVAECTADNLFICKNGVLKTPDVNEGALEGVTRNTILEIANRIGVKVKETKLSRFDLYNADECFLTGTGAEVVPVAMIDTTRIGLGKPGEMTLKLMKEFRILATAGGIS